MIVRQPLQCRILNVSKILKTINSYLISTNKLSMLIRRLLKKNILIGDLDKAVLDETIVLNQISKQ